MRLVVYDRQETSDRALDVLMARAYRKIIEIKPIFGSKGFFGGRSVAVRLPEVDQRSNTEMFNPCQPQSAWLTTSLKHPLTDGSKVGQGDLNEVPVSSANRNHHDRQRRYYFCASFHGCKSEVQGSKVKRLKVQGQRSKVKGQRFRVQRLYPNSAIQMGSAMYTAIFI